MDNAHAIRFYFSFRSPYAWLAAERIERELADFTLELELVPLFPTPETFPNDPVLLPNKVRYMLQDVVRLAKEYELPLRFGAALEADWPKAHAAFLGAQELGAGRRFMLEMFRARFGRACDLGSNEVIAEVATRCELPAERLLAAAHSPSLQLLVSEAFLRGQQRDGIFGVPSFVYRNQLFWGHDRLGSLRRALAEAGR
jgi:2-hydroxychromene-2-carboxylate isomerase